MSGTYPASRQPGNVRQVSQRLAGMGSRIVRTIGRETMLATLVVSIGTAIAKVASAGKDLVVAAAFGRSAPIEAFINASVLPMVVAVVLAGSVTSAFMATYIEVRERDGRDAANALIATVAMFSLGVLTAACALLLVATDLVLQPLGANFSPGKLALMRDFYLILLPIVPLAGVATVWMGVLNAEGRFALAATAPLAIPVLTVAAIIAVRGQLNGYALAYGTLAGYLLQAMVLAVGMRRRRLPVLPRWHGWSPDLARIARLYFPAAMAALLMSSTLVVDQSMAAMLDDGSVAALNYGTKIVALVVGLGATAIGTGVLPRLSALVVGREWTAIRRLLRTYAFLIAAISIPFTVGFYFASDAIVALLFQRGTFTADDAAVVGRVQAMLVLQVPSYAIGILFVSLVTALRRTSVFIWANLINVTCNVVLNYVLMRTMGVAGIALATSIVMLISGLFIWRVSMRLLGEAERASRQVRSGNPAAAVAVAQPPLTQP